MKKRYLKKSEIPTKLQGREVIQVCDFPKKGTIIGAFVDEDNTKWYKVELEDGNTVQHRIEDIEFFPDSSDQARIFNLKLKEYKETLEKAQESYSENVIKLIKDHRNKVFEYSFNDGREGYLRILEDDGEGPKIRFVEFRGLFNEGKKVVYVRFFNVQLYGYKQLKNIIDRTVEEKDLKPFFKDILYGKGFIEGYILKPEQIENNEKPWENSNLQGIKERFVNDEGYCHNFTFQDQLD